MKRKLNVIAKYFYPVAAGIENNIEKTYRPFLNRNWKVVIHTSRDTYNEKGILAKEEKVKGFTVKRYNWNTFLGFWPSIKWGEEQIICLHNFNIIPHLFLIFYSMFLKILGKKKFSLVIIPHGGFSPQWSTFPLYLRIPKYIYHRVISPFLINLGVDGIRAVAHWEKKEMVDAFINPELIKVITNGIEKEAYLDIEESVNLGFKNKINRFGKYIVQIGRIDSIKNQETAIKALSEFTKLKLVLVGPVQNPNYKEKLDLMIKKLGLEKRVIFLGVIRGFEKYFILKKAIAMVHMALWEGNCNVINEAWSQRLFCIVADSKGLNEQINNYKNGFLIGKYDYRTLAQRIKYVMNKKNKRVIDKMTERNLNYVNNNSWEKVSQKVEEFYLERMSKV